MSYITRNIEKDLISSLGKGKAILVYGPRQSGKSTLLRHLFNGRMEDVLWLDADMMDVRSLFHDPAPERFMSMMKGRKILVIDEAQRIESIGLAIKILVDNVKDVDVIATGSSAFELRNRTGEALTGRKMEFYLMPFSYGELASAYGALSESRMLEDRLIYGSYPGVAVDLASRDGELASLASSYLYKDVLSLSGLHKPAILEKLIRALAFQIGSEVSFQELAGLVGADRKTVEKYVEILERCFVLFRLCAFSRNLRNEIKKSVKIYFWDTGIRNAVIGNVLPLSSRPPEEVGHLWENYVIAERKKKMLNKPFPPIGYFWRTHAQQEVDYVEESASGLSAYEIKWAQSRSHAISQVFAKAYPNAGINTVNRSNYADFLGSE